MRTAPSSTPPRGRVALAWAPAVLYMALIWVVSSVSHPPLPVQSFPFADKGVHAVEYGVLAVLVAHALCRTFPHRHLARTSAAAVFVTLAWGVLDEIHQAFVPGRSSDVHDVVADLVGAGIGVLVFVALTLATRRATTRSRSEAR